MPSDNRLCARPGPSGCTSTSKKAAMAAVMPAVRRAIHAAIQGRARTVTAFSSANACKGVSAQT